MDIKSDSSKSKKSPTNSSASSSKQDEDSDSDLDSGSDLAANKEFNPQASLAQKLDELKQKDALMKQMAEQYKNAATVIRDKEGKKMKIEDLQANKQKKLEELNKALVSLCLSVTDLKD